MEAGNREILDKMELEEKNDLLRELRTDCIGHTCPTYNNCTRESNEFLYCFLGSSNCSIHQRKCLCSLHGDVYARFNLNGIFYCSFGKKSKDKLIYTKKVYTV